LLGSFFPTFTRKQKIVAKLLKHNHKWQINQLHFDQFLLVFWSISRNAWSRLWKHVSRLLIVALLMIVLQRALNDYFVKGYEWLLLQGDCYLVSMWVRAWTYEQEQKRYSIYIPPHQQKLTCHHFHMDLPHGHLTITFLINQT
jgi:hypothetical protein